MKKGNLLKITFFTGLIAIASQGCNKRLFKVYFNTDGGSEILYQRVLLNETAKEPEVPTKQDYYFDGWYEDKDKTKKYDFATKITHDITIYAKWALAEYTITFDTFGGTQIASQRVKGGGKVTKPINPIKSDADFMTWCVDMDRKEEFSFNTAIHGDTILYAKYDHIKKITVTPVKRNFKVGETVSKNNFIISALFESSRSLTLEQESFKCPELENGDYTFQLTDIYNNDEFIDGKVFHFTYSRFECEITILPEFDGGTNFSMQHITLLTSDYHQHVVVFNNYSSEWTFESSDTSKLEIVEKKEIPADKQLYITYQIKNKAKTTKNDKIYIKALKNGSLLDYVKIRFYDNSDCALEFVNLDELTCAVYCNLDEVSRRNYDPYGDGTLLIPTYSVDNDSRAVREINSKDGSNAFSNCTKINYVELPNTVLTIGNSAFSFCNELYEVYLPKSLLTIEDYAFNGCSNLLLIDFPEDINVYNFGVACFQSCTSLVAFYVPNSLINMGSSCFQGCSNLCILIVSNDSKLTSVGKDAFNGVSEAMINREKNATYLIAYDEDLNENEHFVLTYIKNAPNITKFTTPEDCYIVSITGAESLVYLNTITIGNNVTAIASYCFHECPNLQRVNFVDITQSKLLGIGENAFSNDSSEVKMLLKEITIPETTVYIGKNAFHSINSTLDSVLFRDPENWSTLDDKGNPREFTKLELSDRVAAANLLNYYHFNAWEKI